MIGLIKSYDWLKKTICIIFLIMNNVRFADLAKRRKAMIRLLFKAIEYLYFVTLTIKEPNIIYEQLLSH